MPPGIESSRDLLEYATAKPSLDHDKVVFNNIKEMQERNQELLAEVRKLSRNLAEKQEECDSIRSQMSDMEKEHESSSRKADSTISGLKEQVEMLEAR